MECKYEGTGIYEGRCYGTKEIDPCPGYDKCSQFKPNFITNADHIRNMSDEELTVFLNEIVVNHHLKIADYCRKCPLKAARPCDTEGIIDWLKQPHKEKEE